MIEWGAKFCWLFTHMPVGKGRRAGTDGFGRAEEIHV